MLDREVSAIDEVLRREGGFVNHPADRGGPTRYGITLDTLRAFRGSPVMASDVEVLERKEAIRIYHQNYIKGPKLDLIKQDSIFDLTFDCAVNHGPKRAVLLLQKAACVFPQDGIMGPITAGVVNRMDEPALQSALLWERVLYYGRIVRKDPKQAVFIVGWLKRAREFA